MINLLFPKQMFRVFENVCEEGTFGQPFQESFGRKSFSMSGKKKVLIFRSETATFRQPFPYLSEYTVNGFKK